MLDDPRYQLNFRSDIAVKFGIKKALIIDQICTATEKPETALQFGGQSWCSRSLKQWRSILPHISEPTIKRHLKELETLKIVVSCEPVKGDRTKAYRIDLNVFNAIMENK